jgi:hypothetical protein
MKRTMADEKQAVAAATGGRDGTSAEKLSSSSKEMGNLLPSYKAAER